MPVWDQISSRPVRMPFHRKGPPSTPKREGASQALDATSSATAASAEAKAKARAKPKAKPTPAPWAKSSPTPSQSGGGADGAAGLRLDPKRINDEVYMMESFATVARHFQQKDMLTHLEQRRRSDLRAKAASMPPKQRLDHLQKRHKDAMTELRRLTKVQATTDDEIRLLQARSREQYEAVETQRDIVEEIRVAMEEAELDMPPTEHPKQVGRQEHPGDLRAALRRSTIPEILEELNAKYTREFGEALSEEHVIGRRTLQGFNMLHSAHDELPEERKVQHRQMEADARVAMKLHRELNPLDVQPGDKRGRTVDLDNVGDERMGVQNEACAEADGWQIAKGRKKGKGRAIAVTSSSTIPGIPIPVGPLATAPRPSAGSSSSGRHHLPARPSAPGTPAVATASGSIQQSSAQPVQADGGTSSALLLPSGATQEQPETPCPDSLPKYSTCG